MTRKQDRATQVRYELMSVPGVCWTITDYETGECKSYEKLEDARAALKALKNN